MIFSLYMCVCIYIYAFGWTWSSGRRENGWIFNVFEGKANRIWLYILGSIYKINGRWNCPYLEWKKRMKHRSRFWGKHSSSVSSLLNLASGGRGQVGNVNTQPSGAPSPHFSEPKGLYLGSSKADHSDSDNGSLFLS